MEIVSALRKALADKVGKERFELWFGTGTRLEFDGRTLVIGLPTSSFLDFIRASFRRQIEDACTTVLGHCPAVVFQVDDLPHGPRDQQVRDGGSADGCEASAAKAKASGEGGGSEAPALRAAVPEGNGAARPPGSNGHHPGNGVPRRRYHGLETFVTGPTNRLAAASAEMVVRDPGLYTPLLIYGSTAVGKTHLLEGIYSAARRTQPRLSAVYLSAEQFTTQFVEALRGSGLPNFRQKYRGVDLLLLDDLHFLVGKRATQTELLHTIDTLLREGRQLVFAADRSPAELAETAELGPELASRLQSGMVCNVELPDYATRRGIVRQLARQMGLRIPPEVQEFIASQLTSHARELSGALCRLKAAAVALGQPIGLAMAEEALSEMIRHSGRAVHLGDISRAVCEVLHMEQASLRSSARAKHVCHPRMLAMWLARKHTRAALSEIGAYFGRKSHSTVISAARQVERWMAAGQPLSLAEQSWKLDDVIRQIERRMRAG